MPDWVYDACDANGLLVYVALARYVDRDGRAFPSLTLIAETAKLSVSTVQRTLKVLEGSGVLRRTRQRRSDGTLGVFDFELAVEAPQVTVTAGTTGHGDRAELDPGVDLEDLPSERSRSSCSSAATEPSRARARDTVGARCAERLCLHLAAKIEGNGCKRPTVTKAWLDAARLLVDVDLARYARPEGDPREDAVIRCIDWATGHDFWAANVLSMPTLRKQWDRLEMQKRREMRPTNGGVGMGRQYDAAIDSLREARERVLAGGTL